jgi:Tfp pilus assembly protein PilX
MEWFMKAMFRNDRGLSLVLVIMAMAILLSITGAGLLFSNLNLKASSNLRGGTAALQAADAGIQHALAKVPAGGDFDSFWAGTGLADFPCKNSSGSTGTCDGTNYKPTLTGSLSGYAYTVEVTNDTSVGGELAANDTNKIIIFTSTATGPNGSQRKVRAYIGRSPWIPPGTIYIPGTPANAPTQFNGNSFALTGNDTNPDGTAGPLAAISAVATNNADETTAISGPGGTLNSGQYGQVTGLGSNPSVATVTNLDVNQLADDLIASAGADLQTESGGTFKSSDGDVGTSSQPKVTHVTGNATLTCGSGSKSNAIGYGVLIVDGNLTIQGNFQFQGLIIARGENVTIGGNGSKLSGSLLVKESATSGGLVKVGGNASFRYSSQALNTYVLSRWGGAFSTNARIIAWHEMMV